MIVRPLNFKLKNNFNTIINKYSATLIVACLSIIVGISIGWQWSQRIAISEQQLIKTKITELENLVSQITQSSTLDKASLSYQINLLQDQIENISTESAVLDRDQLQRNMELVKEIETKYQTYLAKGAKVATKEAELNKIFTSLVTKDDQLEIQVNNLNSQLDLIWQDKLDFDAKKLATQTPPISNNPNSGYSRITVQTERGNFVTDIISAPLNATKVLTVTGNDGNCDHNCTAKPLAQYISDNGGFAGMNGTYFCPPDYSSCSNKTYSFDFPVYSSIHNKWINADKLFWNDRSMIAFTGSTPRFCQSANSCHSGGVNAGIVNYPALVTNHNVIVNEGELPDTLTKNKGFRGAIGVTSDKILLVIVRGATVTEAAHVLKNIGAQHALNLDGGGSSAMYYGGYKVGPGRLLPNAIILKQ